MQHSTRLAAAALVALLIGGCNGKLDNGQGGPLVDEPTQPLAIVQQIQGSDSGLAGAMVLVINSAAELEELGSTDLAEHAIDFGEHSVVLVAWGECPTAGYAVRIDAVQQAGDWLFVQGLATQPAPDQMVADVLTYPYAAAVIGKVDASLVKSEIDTIEGAVGE